MNAEERISPTNEERWQAEKEEIYAAHAQLIQNQRAYHEAEVAMYRSQIAALRDAAKKATPGPWQVSYLDEGIAEIETVDGGHIAVADGRPADAEFIVAARAVVDAVETERCPDCGHAPHDSLGFCPNMASDNECNCNRSVPSPARDDAETCKHPFPARYPDGLHHCRDCGLSWDEPPAHMAAPDELTALAEEVDQYVFESIPLIAQQRDTAEAERDALRERLEDCRTSLNNHIRSEDALREKARALADEWDATVLLLGGTNRKPVPRWFSQRLREMLENA